MEPTKQVIPLKLHKVIPLKFKLSAIEIDDTKVDNLNIERELRKQERAREREHLRNKEFQQVKIGLEDLITNLKTETDGYVHIRFREIIAGTRWNHFLLVLPKISDTFYLHKFVTNCYLAVCGLSQRGCK